MQRFWSSPSLAFVAPGLVVDWLVPVVLTLISDRISRLAPYEREITLQVLSDPSLARPHHAIEQVSVAELDNLAFRLPLAILVVWTLATKRGRERVMGVHHAVLGLISSRALMRFVIEAVKNRVGRFRPDFVARCEWSGIACTGSAAVIREGRRSFPSGHSGTAWQGCVFLMLFLAGQTRAFSYLPDFPRGPLHSRQLRLMLTLSPLVLSAWIAITRIEDNWHHPTDVLAGSLLGSLASLAIYLIYFQSPFGGSSDEAFGMGVAKVVYELQPLRLEDEDVLEEDAV